MQPRENQSALLSYAVPFCSTSGAMYPWVPLGEERARRYQNTSTSHGTNHSPRGSASFTKRQQL